MIACLRCGAAIVLGVSSVLAAQPVPHSALAASAASTVPANTRVAELTLLQCDALVRPERLFRCRVRWDAGATLGEDEPGQLQATLAQDGLEIAGIEIPLERLSLLRDPTGVGVVLVPQLRPQSTAPVRLSLGLGTRRRPSLGHAERVLATPTSLATAFAAAAARQGSALPAAPQRASAPRPALWPQLWIQLGEELLRGSDAVRETEKLRALTAALDAWPAGATAADFPPPLGLWALRDPIDGGAVPFRLDLPAEPATARAVLIVLHGAAEPGDAAAPAAWAALAPTWCERMAAAGFVRLEICVGGDRRGNGLTGHRIDLALVEAARRRPGLERLPLVVLGVGLAGLPASAAAEALGAPCLVVPGPALPEAAHLIALAANDTASDRASALRSAALGTRRSADRPQLRPAFARGPFLVVAGTGEHLAAQEDNRALALSFALAWRDHAGTTPRIVADDPAQLASGCHLVCTGNARSNRVIAAAVAALARRSSAPPIRTDDRSLFFTPPGEATQRFPRADRGGLHWTLPHPSVPTLTIVVLDGRPIWAERSSFRRGDLPLAEVPDLALAGAMPLAPWRFPR